MQRKRQHVGSLNEPCDDTYETDDAVGRRDAPFLGSLSAVHKLYSEMKLGK